MRQRLMRRHPVPNGAFTLFVPDADEWLSSHHLYISSVEQTLAWVLEKGRTLNPRRSIVCRPAAVQHHWQREVPERHHVFYSWLQAAVLKALHQWMQCPVRTPAVPVHGA